MPRLPTILVIGSQDMSTMLGASGWTLSRVAMVIALLVAPARLVAGGQLVAVVAPARLLVDRRVRDAAQLADQRPVGGGDGRREPTAGRRVYERHDLKGEAGHPLCRTRPTEPGLPAHGAHPDELGPLA